MCPASLCFRFVFGRRTLPCTRSVFAVRRNRSCTFGFYQRNVSGVMLSPVFRSFREAIKLRWNSKAQRSLFGLGFQTAGLEEKRIWIRVASKFVFPPMHRTLTLRCTMRVSLQHKRSPICISNSTSEMVVLESWSLEKLPVAWSRRVFKR